METQRDEDGRTSSLRGGERVDPVLGSHKRAGSSGRGGYGRDVHQVQKARALNEGGGHVKTIQHQGSGDRRPNNPV